MKLFRMLFILVLALLVILPAAAQETEVPAASLTLWASTRGLDETAPAIVPPAPVEALPDTDAGIEDERYLATLDRLVSLVENIITFLPVGLLGSLLLVMAGALYVIVRLTPTKKDDEIVDRLWKKVEARFFGELPSVSVSAQRMADKYGYNPQPDDGLQG